MFQIDVAKVDLDIAYVVMVIHVCYKCLLPMFHQCFWTYVTSVFICMLLSHICCMCFIWILHMFANVFKCFHVFFKYFKSMLQVCVSNVSIVFRHILQVFYLNVAYVAVATHIYCKRMFQIFHMF
jgi:hypothetical protein